MTPMVIRKVILELAREYHLAIVEVTTEKAAKTADVAENLELRRLIDEHRLKAIAAERLLKKGGWL